MKNILTIFQSLFSQFRENGISSQQAERLAFEELFSLVKSLPNADQGSALDDMNDWLKDHFFQYIESDFGGEQTQAFWDRKRSEKRDFADFMERVDTHIGLQKLTTEFGEWFWQ